MNKNKGFTLFELIISLAIIGIVGAIAVPQFSQLMADKSLDDSAREMSIALNEGRSRAALVRNTVVVCAGKKANGDEMTKEACVASQISGANANDFIEQNRVLISRTPEKIGLSSGSDMAVVFKADGTSTAKKQFIFCSDGEARKVNVSILGGVGQEKGSC